MGELGFFSEKQGDRYVKICGITSTADARAAIEAGADAIGVNFFSGSKRYVPYKEARHWLGEMSVPRIAVMVNPSRDEVTAILKDNLIDGVQLHGDESPSFCSWVQDQGVPVIKAFRIRDRSSLSKTEGYPGVFAHLFDTYRETAFGGTGETFDWTFLQSALPGIRVILSGGLNPSNVGEAVSVVHPFAVDVASGVEKEGNPREKDPAKMRKFVLELRSQIYE
jgi:phosphoribosylanthranilate isomerase